MCTVVVVVEQKMKHNIIIYALIAHTHKYSTRASSMTSWHESPIYTVLIYIYKLSPL